MYEPGQQFHVRTKPTACAQCAHACWFSWTWSVILLEKKNILEMMLQEPFEIHWRAWVCPIPSGADFQAGNFPNNSDDVGVNSSLCGLINRWLAKVTDG